MDPAVKPRDVESFLFEHAQGIPVETINNNAVACSAEACADIIKAFYTENHLDALFLFRIETYCLIKINLDFFPLKYIDLDELGSRRNQLISQLQSHQARPSNDMPSMQTNTFLRLTEKTIVPKFTKIFVASEIEAMEVQTLTASEAIYVLPNTLPPRIFTNRQPAEDPQTILFIGTLSYFPNEDAIYHFCYDIFPLIRQAMGEKLIFQIVGLSCPPSLRKVEKEPGVQLLGFQENLESLYANASLVVSPLRAGTGTRIKIIEAFTYRRPVVSTSIGAMGLNVHHEKDILLADDPQHFADSCLRILQDPLLAASLSQAALTTHQKFYSPEALARSYIEAIATP